MVPDPALILTSGSSQCSPSGASLPHLTPPHAIIMREEDRKLFPLVTVGSVVQLFRWVIISTCHLGFGWNWDE